MRRMDKITGRSDDMLIIRGVNVFPTQIEEQILKVEGLAPHYQIEISRENNLDSMLVNVELKPDAAEEKKSGWEKELQKHIKDIVGVSSHVAVHVEGGVARSEGKAQRVIDKRDLK